MKIGKTDTFEDVYMTKFRNFASEYGVFIEYTRDAAARDIGLHFTQDDSIGGKNVTPSLAWFQMKGIMSSTKSAAELKSAKEVSLSLQSDHLIFWFLQPAPTYLVVYIESFDSFLIINIQRWIEVNFGEDILNTSQKTHTVKIALGEKLDDHAFYVIMRDNMIASLKKRLDSDDRTAKRFYRDAEVIKWLQSCEDTAIQTRLTYISWISKMRSEAHFEYMLNGKWETFRIHWEFALDNIEKAFPYIDFLGMDEEFLEEWRDDNDDDDAEIISLSNGTVSAGPNCSYEYYRHEIPIKLNSIGNRWSKTLSALEKAGAITVSSESGGFVSVAPWHARQL